MSAGALGSFLLSAGFATMAPLVPHSGRVSHQTFRLPAHSQTPNKQPDPHHTSSVLINIAGTGKAAQTSTRFAQDICVPLSNRGSQNAQFAK
jgi:hypothetical protein